MSWWLWLIEAAPVAILLRSFATVELRRWAREHPVQPKPDYAKIRRLELELGIVKPPPKPKPAPPPRDLYPPRDPPRPMTPPAETGQSPFTPGTFDDYLWKQRKWMGK